MLGLYSNVSRCTNVTPQKCEEGKKVEAPTASTQVLSFLQAVNAAQRSGGEIDTSKKCKLLLQSAIVKKQNTRATRNSEWGTVCA